MSIPENEVQKNNLSSSLSEKLSVQNFSGLSDEFAQTELATDAALMKEMRNFDSIITEILSSQINFDHNLSFLNKDFKDQYDESESNVPEKLAILKNLPDSKLNILNEVLSASQKYQPYNHEFIDNYKKSISPERNVNLAEKLGDLSNFLTDSLAPKRDLKGQLLNGHFKTSIESIPLYQAYNTLALSTMLPTNHAKNLIPMAQRAGRYPLLMKALIDKLTDIANKIGLTATKDSENNLAFTRELTEEKLNHADFEKARTLIKEFITKFDKTKRAAEFLTMNANLCKLKIQNQTQPDNSSKITGRYYILNKENKSDPFYNFLKYLEIQSNKGVKHAEQQFFKLLDFIEAKESIKSMQSQLDLTRTAPQQDATTLAEQLQSNIVAARKNLENLAPEINRLIDAHATKLETKFIKNTLREPKEEFQLGTFGATAIIQVLQLAKALKPEKVQILPRSATPEQLDALITYFVEINKTLMKQLVKDAYLTIPSIATNQPESPLQDSNLMAEKLEEVRKIQASLSGKISDGRDFQSKNFFRVTSALQDKDTRSQLKKGPRKALFDIFETVQAETTKILDEGLLFKMLDLKSQSHPPESQNPSSDELPATEISSNQQKAIDDLVRLGDVAVPAADVQRSEAKANPASLEFETAPQQGQVVEAPVNADVAPMGVGSAFETESNEVMKISPLEDSDSPHHAKSPTASLLDINSDYIANRLNEFKNLKPLMADNSRKRSLADMQPDNSNLKHSKVETKPIPQPQPSQSLSKSFVMSPIVPKNGIPSQGRLVSYNSMPKSVTHNGSFGLDSPLSLASIQQFYEARKDTLKVNAVFSQDRQTLHLKERQVDIGLTHQEITIKPYVMQTISASNMVENMLKTLVEVAAESYKQNDSMRLQCDIDGFTLQETEFLLKEFLKPANHAYVMPQLSDQSRKLLESSPRFNEISKTLETFEKIFNKNHSRASPFSGSP